MPCCARRGRPRTAPPGGRRALRRDRRSRGARRCRRSAPRSWPLRRSPRSARRRPPSSAAGGNDASATARHGAEVGAAPRATRACETSRRAARALARAPRRGRRSYCRRAARGHALAGRQTRSQVGSVPGAPAEVGRPRRHRAAGARRPRSTLPVGRRRSAPWSPRRWRRSGSPRRRRRSAVGALRPDRAPGFVASGAALTPTGFSHPALHRATMWNVVGAVWRLEKNSR
jgi:hypothetical protein